MVLTVALYANTQHFRLTRMGATQLKRRHKTHPVREGSIPKNSYHVIGGELLLQQYRWWCFVGLNHDPDTYKVSALPIELKHHVSALICVPANRNISHTLKSGVHRKLPNHVHGANSGNRTRTFCLEGRCSTIKLYRRIGGTHGYNRQRVLKGVFMRYKKINRKENYSMKRK